MDSLERDLFNSGFELVAGVDEAGRGPLAGPVAAAAVIFPRPWPLEAGIRDSKTLSPKRREALALEIFQAALSVGVGVVWQAEIDRINIHRASLLAMERAVKNLSPLPVNGLSRPPSVPIAAAPQFLLIDGPHRVDSPIPQRPVTGGDTLSVSIAAASIIAKTFRDRIMLAYDRIFPAYNFYKNKGYGTREHLEALRRVGPSPVHRFSFRGVLNDATPAREKKPLQA